MQVCAIFISVDSCLLMNFDQVVDVIDYTVDTVCTVYLVYVVPLISREVCVLCTVECRRSQIKHLEDTVSVV
jgi:hypothetical protein